MSSRGETKDSLRARRKAAAARRPSAHISVDLVVWMVFVWIAAFGSVEPLTLLAALAVALGIQWLFPLPNRSGVYAPHPFAVIWLILRFVWDMSRAAVHVTVLILFPRPREDAILRIEVRSGVPEYLAILVAMTTLVPGTVVVEVDTKERLVYLHCLDVEGQGGIAAIKSATLAQEARIIRAVAPRSVIEEFGLSRGQSARPDGEKVANG